MKTNINLGAASASSPQDNLCFDIDPAVATLNVFADDGHSYQLPYAQFMYAEWTSNPALEREPDAEMEKLLTRFVKAEVVVLGNGLKPLIRAIQKTLLFASQIIVIPSAFLATVESESLFHGCYFLSQR
jgi:hypothetical protein